MIAKVLTNQRGAMVPGIGYFITVALLILALATHVLATTGSAVSATRDAQVQSVSLAAGRATLAQARIADGDAQSPVLVDGSTGAAGSYLKDEQRMTIDAQHDGREAGSEAVPVRDFSAGYVIGYDANGNPVWGNETGSIAHSLTGLVASGARTCGIDQDGYAWCWGANSHGQVGDGTTRDAHSPTKVAGDTKFDALAVSDLTTCGIAREGRALWCWGANDREQLRPHPATGTSATVVPTPERVDGTTGYAQVAVASRGIVGITTAGQVRASGELTRNDSPAFRQMATDAAVRTSRDAAPAVGADAQTGCFLTNPGALMCWSTDRLGLPRNDSPESNRRPFPGASGFGASPLVLPIGQPSFEHGRDVTRVGTGTYTSVYLAAEDTKTTPTVACAITGSGTGECFAGAGGTPPAITGAGITDIAVSSSSACAVGAGGRVNCTGVGLPAVPVASGASDIEVSTGNTGTYCANVTGRVTCWGSNTHGQATSVPGGPAGATIVLDSRYPRADSIALSDQTSCSASVGHNMDTGAINDARMAYTGCWGRNDLGQTGAGSPGAEIEVGRTFDRAHDYATVNGYVTGGQR